MSVPGNTRPAQQGSRPPTLLVPGWSDRAAALLFCRDFLLAAGWPAGHVECLDFDDPYGSNVEHAAQLADAAAALARTTGSDRVAVVAHSMGGLALRYALATSRPAIDTAIFVGTPHRGTWAAYLAHGRGGAEMRPGSPFLRALNERRLPPGVRAVCITTPIDTRVLPGSSARLDGAECHTTRLPTHPRMLRHAPTLRLIRDLLAHPRTGPSP